MYMTKYLRISSYIRKPFLIYDFATAPSWISLYMRKILFYFLSVYTLLDKRYYSTRYSVYVTDADTIYIFFEFFTV